MGNAEVVASKSEKRFCFPTAFTILFGLTILAAVLTWIVPAGQYERVYDESLGREVTLVGSYQQVEANPQNAWDVLMAPVAGLYDPGSYEANAIDVALFVLIIGGFIGVVTATGAIDAGIGRAMKRMAGHEKWMIPLLMGLFALGGTTYGMAEETLAFYMLLIPIIIAAGYDSVTAVAIILLGAGVGVLGSTVNAFATVIASDAAGIPFTDGLTLRLMILVLCFVATVLYVMRYAAKVKRNPEVSIVGDQREADREYFLSQRSAEELPFTRTRMLVLALFAATFLIMVWGVLMAGWWMGEMTALFLASSLVIGVTARLGEARFVESFVGGAKELLGVALIIGLARGIVVIMDAGLITDTILHWSEERVSGLSNVAFINVMYWLQIMMSFFVPSSSGLAVMSMPVLAPMADFAGVGRDLVVTAYQSANGLVNLINPTFAVVMGALAIGRVPYERWLRFMWPLLVILTLVILGCLSLAAMLG
ncbi:YfcC family protein [Halomonas sp. MCCC 1A17488]|uniref:YfcC family protein n=1 Tax=Billgrantia sulfidoxydans TaxID=2733484 RepID=A0ABX7W271_9GAMM|nr:MULTISPECIES: YfcC family protein [Halomonas]MCE8016026.1 YfcC family protein [Halomonas sp. MCCC 1A17488]MCG3239359.1 YfcC family protein [Halomonas sp. MCCC 1A17488]QPP50711.1 YfcC family protein [Halomonas sp. SS10-MC5]QTP54288.1 YfcC family protein [Halomonas sulfidoxydans]